MISLLDGYAPCVTCGKYVDDGGFVEGRIMCHKCLDERGDNNREFLRLIEKYFAVSNDKGSLVLETWTDAGINLTFVLKKGTLSLLDEFKSVITNFDPAEQIKKMREKEEYKANFSIEESFNDFEHKKCQLLNVYQKIEGKFKNMDK